ncbi:histone-lysine N-methyltransferase SETMAR [Plakobranchus ocellatus]|uniref:Histone-lysine N-methyltransferase SETMAR n=1 Tax=Plakobranchus ocellatus TaxID=259542 RepID=A0AAV3ZGA4_9GAST|nr:histone-lysine N-methyltransferase SETMAR [Plakobranchus ocellatus]
MYCETIDRLRHAVRRKRPELLRSGVVLQHDNPTPHTAKRTKECLNVTAITPLLALEDNHLAGGLAPARLAKTRQELANTSRRT